MSPGGTDGSGFGRVELNSAMRFCTVLRLDRVSKKEGYIELLTGKNAIQYNLMQTVGGKNI